MSRRTNAPRRNISNYFGVPFWKKVAAAGALITIPLGVHYVTHYTDARIRIIRSPVVTYEVPGTVTEPTLLGSLARGEGMNSRTERGLFTDRVRFLNPDTFVSHYNRVLFEGDTIEVPDMNGNGRADIANK